MPRSQSWSLQDARRLLRATYTEEREELAPRLLDCQFWTTASRLFGNGGNRTAEVFLFCVQIRLV